MKYITVILFICLSLLSCRREPQKPVFVEGRAQGTMYRITFYGEDSPGLRKGVDSIFGAIDNSLSIYNPNSVISLYNTNRAVQPDSHFIRVLTEAMSVAAATGGYFDFTVRPVAEAWKRNRETALDSAVPDSLKVITGWRLVKFEDGKIVKNTPGVQIDLNAIAQGYTVDVLGDYLLGSGIENFIIELGGEVKAHGCKPGGTSWNAGIERPPQVNSRQGDAVRVVALDDMALATSGSYRQFYIRDGKKYTHIIDPLTLRPVRHNLLSVAVMARKCSVADAYATAFMAMGLERSVQFLKLHPELKAFFILADSSRGFRTLDRLR